MRHEFLGEPRGKRTGEKRGSIEPPKTPLESATVKLKDHWMAIRHRVAARVVIEGHNP